MQSLKSSSCLHLLRLSSHLVICDFACYASFVFPAATKKNLKTHLKTRKHSCKTRGCRALQYVRLVRMSSRVYSFEMDCWGNHGESEEAALWPCPEIGRRCTSTRYDGSILRKPKFSCHLVGPAMYHSATEPGSGAFS